MAGRFETAVRNREQRWLLQDCRKEMMQNDHKDHEAVERVPSPDRPGMGTIEEKEFANSWKDFIVSISSTLIEEPDNGRRLQFLMQAKSLAVELIKTYGA